MKPAPAERAPLSQWLRWLEDLHPRQIELGLDRVSKVAVRLGLTSSGTPTLSIAGTNGKGTSARLATAMLQAQGLRVGLYTSPHLLRYNERFEIAGTPATDREICQALHQVNLARGEVSLTYFEAGTLAALCLFAERSVDVQVLEVGLGARLDAVNLIDADVGLLTSVGIDHVAWLGPDREAIGLEKAHIFRADKPAICGDPQPPESVIEHATAIGARLEIAGRDFRLDRDDTQASWIGDGCKLENLQWPRQGGGAVKQNLAAVIAAVNRLPASVRPGEAAIRDGLAQFSISGRFQRRDRLLLDVAHNVQAAELLSTQLREHFGSRRLCAVIGMLEGKDVAGFLAGLAQSLATVHGVTLPGSRGLDAAQLCQAASSLGLSTRPYDDIDTAIDDAIKISQDEMPVLVTGSFLTVEAGLSYG